ncbi:MAG: hypothetical protein ACI9RP_001483 [Cyclobacteriaceae bacterium]|jgi:hypothetical protein
MRDEATTRKYYFEQLGFSAIGSVGYDDYLMLEKDQIQVHFFKLKALESKENYGQVYIRMDEINCFYQSLIDNRTKTHPNVPLQVKPWGQKEFSVRRRSW